MKRIRHFFEYLLFLGVGVIACILPRRVALFLGARIGDFGFYCVPIRKKVTIQNLTQAFPEKEHQEIMRIARRVYQNLGINAIEHLRFPGLNRAKLLQIVKIEGEEHIRQALDRGKGIIFVGGHFGNWEYMGCSISAAGYPISFVVADIHNRFLDKMVNSHRKKMGVTIIPKGIAVRGMLRALKKNGSIAMLMDQDAGRGGVFVDFLGRPSATAKGPATFALKTGAVILFMISFREKDLSLKVVIDKIETEHLSETNAENIKDITQRCTARLEKYIRQYPDQWFWMHRRWKTVPLKTE